MILFLFEPVVSLFDRYKNFLQPSAILRLGSEPFSTKSGEAEVEALGTDFP
jgi:hypothetical protein